MPSVDLRGNKVEDDVVEQISTCVNKIDHFNLRSTQITPKGIERIWKKIALREKPVNFYKLLFFMFSLLCRKKSPIKPLK